MAKPEAIIWSQKALRQLFEVGDYIDQRFGTTVANQFVNDAFSVAENLLEFPELGKLSKKYKTVRWLLLGKYHRMYYRIKGASVFIVRLADTRRNPKRDPYR